MTEAEMLDELIEDIATIAGRHRTDVKRSGILISQRDWKTKRVNRLADEILHRVEEAVRARDRKRLLGL